MVEMAKLVSDDVVDALFNPLASALGIKPSEGCSDRREVAFVDKFPAKLEATVLQLEAHFLVLVADQAEAIRSSKVEKSFAVLEFSDDSSGV